MKRQLQEAILSSLCDEKPEPVELARFTHADWQRVYPWLDASGLALYFLDRLSFAGRLQCLPEPVRARLMQNRADQQARTAQMFGEFTRINRAFQAASLNYAVLKGFSLIPDYCPEPSLRYQFDFDFLAQRASLPQFAYELTALGYELTHTDETEWHFEMANDRVPSASSLYKPKPQHAVELHCGVGHGTPLDAPTDAMLACVSERKLKDLTFPALSPADMFLMQALHLFGHISGEWTRISWLLEYRNFVHQNRDDTALWEAVRARSTGIKCVAIAIGVSTLLATLAFGEFAPPELDAWTVNKLPPATRLWLETYGSDVIFATFPGTKLYLLLQRELISDEQKWRQMRHARIVPLHLPVPVVNTRKAGKALRPRAYWSKFSFLVFRLRFHLRQGFRYWRESRRWAKMCESMQQSRPGDPNATLLASSPVQK